MASQALLIDASLKKIEYLFRLIGVNIKVEYKSRSDKYRCLIIFVFVFLWLNTDFVAPVYWFIDAVAKHKKFTELTYVASCFIFTIFSDIKISGIVLNERIVDMLIENIRDLEKSLVNYKGSLEVENIIQTEHERLQRILKVLSIFYLILAIVFSLSPLGLVLLNYYKTNEVEFLLPVSVIYPFDSTDMRYYPWIYLHQCISVVIVIIYITVADFIFYIFCTYLRMQFRLLHCYMVKVIPFETNDFLNNTTEINIEMVRLIKWHQQILSATELLEKIYTRPTLFNFIASSILICLTGFNLVEIDAFVLSFLCFLMMSLLQIFCLCYYGDTLKESSISVGDAVYNSKWYLADPKLGKTMLLIQTRSQTPCNLTAWGYADVNLKAFMKICSTAWSYFALLQTVYTGPIEQQA